MTKRFSALLGAIALVSASLVFAQTETLSQSYRGSKARDWEFQKTAPIKVFDNLYYVGPGNVSVWLIPTTDGLMLFDTTQEPLVDHVLDSIRKVGFSITSAAPARSNRRRRARGSRRSRRIGS
jgi:hypothetical protein